MSGVQGRVAAVTGAAQGIGAAVAQRLAEGGARVALLDRDTERVSATAERLREAGHACVAVSADVSSRAEVEAGIDHVVATFGELHILVNNAGVLRDAMLFKMTDDDWTTVLNVHLQGAFLCTQAAQAHMVRAGYGRIVSLSSTSALGNRGQANYAAAKMGLQGFTRTVALELGPFGVTANAVAPGFIETEMTAATAQRLGSDIETMREQVAARVPVRRGGQPADIAHAVAFLAAEESGFVTGQTLYVDGGSKI